MTTFRAYIRVSTAKQEQGISLTTQREALAAYAAAHGGALAHEYVDILSGTRDDRPRYQAMLADIQPGDTILIWRLDRVGRKKSELFRLFEWCKKNRVSLVSVTQPEMSNELARDIMSVLAAYESQQIAERVLPNLTRGVEDGKWMSRIPHFYKMGEDGHLTPTEDAWQAQECWEMFLRTGNRNLTAAAYGLGTRQLWWMMRSPVYVGAIPWVNTVREGAHPAIVRRETWEAARALIESRRVGKRRENPRSALLVGFIYVEDTPRRMLHKPMRSKNHQYRYYTTDMDRYHGTARHVVRADYAESVVLDHLRGLAITAGERRELERGMRERLRSDPHKRARAAVERSIAALESEQVATERSAARGVLSGPVVERMRREQVTEMAALIARRDALPSLPDPKSAAPLLAARINLRRDIDEAVDLGDTAALRLLVEAFIARVEVWGAESPRLHGGAARTYWAAHPPEIRVVPVPGIGN